MRARSARRLSVLPARTQLSSVERSSGVKVRAVGYLLMPHHDIDRFSLQLSASKTNTPPRFFHSRGVPAPSTWRRIRLSSHEHSLYFADAQWRGSEKRAPNLRPHRYTSLACCTVGGWSC